MYDYSQFTTTVFWFVVLSACGIVAAVVSIFYTLHSMLGKNKKTKASRIADIDKLLVKAFTDATVEEARERQYPKHFTNKAKRNQDRHRLVRRRLRKEGRKAARKGK